MTNHTITITISADDPTILNNCYNTIEQYLSTLTYNDTFLSSSTITTSIYPLDDGPLTTEQINNIKSISSATNIPNENFKQHI